jgi:sulfate transport system ATP-binding protein
MIARAIPRCSSRADQDEALELADRVAILHRGRLEQIGSADEVYDHPATPFVCEFLRRDATAFRFKSTMAMCFQDTALLPSPARGVRGNADLYVRPHHLRILDASEQGLPEFVSTVRRHGASRQASISVAGLGLALEIDLNDRPTPAVGEHVALRISKGSLFSAA